MEIPIANGRCILPEHIQGHPLVTIWENALENISCDVLEIPRTVVRLSSGFFLYFDGSFDFYPWEQYRCPIGSISVPPDHPVLEVIGGALFHKENKELLFFPPDQKGHYSVPEGTKRIAAFAFSRCALTGITLPESLESIGQYSFMSCQNLQTVEGLRETIKCDKDAFPFLQCKKKDMQS